MPSLGDVVGLCSATVTAPTFTLGCSGEVITATTTDPLVYNNQGAYTITWTFDNNNGFFQVLTQNVIVDDMIAPTFDQVAPADLEVSCDNIPPMAVLTATDACGPVTVVPNEQITPGDCPNRYTITRTWDVTDANGNAAPTQTQIITVVDNAGPVLTSTIDLKLQVNCASIPDAPEPVFVDNCSGVITVAFEETQTEVINNQYSITRTWIAKDACGNASEEIEQVIYVDVIAEIVATENSEICNAAEFDVIELPEELPAGTPTGGTWINVDNVAGLTGTTFSPYNGGTLVPVGNYTFSYVYNDGTACPSRVNVIINVNDICKPLDCGNIIVHNAFTPNGDGVNEYFDIENIENFVCYPTNKVEIYNRWGVLVYETEQYDNALRRFEGISEGRVTVDKSAELPTGTYFYILQYTTSDGDTISESKYLYLTR
nr:gliding motility-associated C-terminal domain-containing protein [Flavobacterium dankookense]